MNHELKTKKGQTLIEVIIAIAIGTLIVTAILGLATRSNRNANFARASEQASKLSQQGLEIVRNVRDVGGDNSIISPPIDCVGCATWDDLYSNNLDDLASEFGREFKLIPDTDASCSPTPVSWCLSGDTSTPETIIEDIQNFTRRIFIADTDGEASNCNDTINYDGAKQVTVLVQWTDPVGSHEAKVTSCINNI